MKRNRVVLIAAGFCLLIFLAGYLTTAAAELPAFAEDRNGIASATLGGTTGVYISTVASVLADNQASHEQSSDYLWESSNVIPITLNGTGIAASGAGIIVAGNKATITAAGTYSLSGANYIAYYGGSANGTATDGLYNGGSYTPGAKYAKFTVSSVVTKISRMTDVDGEETAPAGFQLFHAYPNPFNPQTSLRYVLEAESQVRLTIYNLQGEEVARLVEGNEQAGNHTVVWNAAGMASGVYLVRLFVGEKRAIERILLMK